MSWKVARWIPVTAALVVGVLHSAVGQNSTSYRLTSGVFTHGGGAAVVGSENYRASVSLGQRSIVGDASIGGNYVLQSGFQALTLIISTVPPDIESYADWIAGYGLTGLDADPGLDYDGDGFTNFQEYIADTDPTREDSRLHLVYVEQGGSTASVSFYGSVNRVYELWFTPDLTNPDLWELILGPIPGEGGGDMFIHERDAAKPAGFYRVHVALP